MKDRIINKENGISVEKKKSTNYKLYYYIFHLSDKDYEESSSKLWNIDYNNFMEIDSVIKLKEGDCVCLIEKEGDREVERYEFYYRKRKPEGHMKCQIKKAPFWGKNTWRIAFFCDSDNGDEIGSRHFKVCYQNQQFAFPRETVLIRGKKSRKKSMYYIALPDKVDIRDVSVSVDEVVQGKYTYDCKRK